MHISFKKRSGGGNRDPPQPRKHNFWCTSWTKELLKAGVPFPSPTAHPYHSSPETMVFLRVSLPTFPQTTSPGPERGYGGVGIRKVALETPARERSQGDPQER